MAHFQRTLPPRAFPTTRRLAFSSGSWMRDLLCEWAPSGTPGSLRLAVRNGYLNFYHFGQSVSKVEFPKRGETATASIHHKYVRNAEGQTYLKIHTAEGLDVTGRKTCKWGGSAMLASWIAKAAGHANCEKRHIDTLLDRSPKVIDLEIALPARGDKRSAPRIDIAALEGPSDGHRPCIVFWEVKRINDARLRSEGVPKVVEQIGAYEEYVRSVPQLFENAYRENCRILCKFHRIASDLWETPPLDPLISAVAGGEYVEVDAEPRLLIVEDECPKSNWDHHLSKLTSCLTDRVRLAQEGDVDPIEAIPTVPHQSA